MHGALGTGAFGLAMVAFASGCASDADPPRLENATAFSPGDTAMYGGSEPTAPTERNVAGPGTGAEDGPAAGDLDGDDLGAPDSGEIGGDGAGVTGFTGATTDNQPGTGQASPGGTGFGSVGADQNTGTGFDLTPNVGSGASLEGAEILNVGPPGMGQAGPTGTGFGNGNSRGPANTQNGSLAEEPTVEDFLPRIDPLGEGGAFGF